MKTKTKKVAPVKSAAEPLTPADIRRIRESLGLNQVEAGELLGGGIRAFQKYESGTITPAATTISLLRILEADPTALGALTGTHVPIQQTGCQFARKSVPLFALKVSPLSAGVCSRPAA
jgi:DNA-binding transcriptional regulator YiaG